VDEKGEPWFLAKDVCDVLGYKNANDAIKKHCDPEDVTNLKEILKGSDLLPHKWREELQKLKEWVERQNK